MSLHANTTEPKKPKSSVARLTQMINNDFDYIETIVRPHEAQTFSLKTWDTVHRHQDHEAALAAARAEQEKYESLEAEMWATPQDVLAKSKFRKASLKKTIEPMSAPSEDSAEESESVEAVVKSHLRQDSSAIMSTRKAPQLRECRRPERFPPRSQVTATVVPLITSPPSHMPFSQHTAPSSLLQRLQRLRLQKEPRALVVEGSVPNRGTDAVPIGSDTALSSSPPNEADTSARSQRWKPPFRSDEGLTAITNHTTGLRGPLTLMHPIRGVRRINYAELYRDQFTAARDLLAADDNYITLIENLDFHMASVRFTFHSMLDGKFTLDEAEKKRAIEQSCTASNRTKDTTSVNHSTDNAASLNPLQRIALRRRR